MVMGMILVYGALTLVCNLIADLLYGWLDPRVRLMSKRTRTALVVLGRAGRAGVAGAVDHAVQP